MGKAPVKKPRFQGNGENAAKFVAIVEKRATEPPCRRLPKALKAKPGAPDARARRDDGRSRAAERELPYSNTSSGRPYRPVTSLSMKLSYTKRRPSRVRSWFTCVMVRESGATRRAKPPVATTAAL